MGIFKYSFARTAGGWTTTGTSPVALAPSPSFNGDPSLVIPAGDNLRNALAYDTLVGVASGDTIVVSVAVRAASGSGTATLTSFVYNYEGSQTSIQGPVGITSAGWTTITQTIVVSPLMGNNPGCAINVQCSSASFVGEISIAGDQLNTVVPVWHNFHTQPGDPGHWVGGGGVWRTPGGGGGIYVVPNPQSGTTYNTDTDTVPLAGMPGAIPVGGNNFPELGIPSPTHVQTTVVLPGVSPGDTIHFRPHTSPSRNTSPFLQILVTWLDRVGNPVGPVASFSTVGPDTPASYGVVVPPGAGSNPNVRIQIHPNSASLFYLFRLDLYSDALGKNVYTALFHGGEIPPAIGVQGLNIKAPDAGFFDPAVGIMVIAGNGAATPADQRDTLRIIPDPATPAWEVVLALTFAKNDKDKLTLGFKAKTEVGSSIVHAYVQWGDFNSGSLIGNKVAVCGGSVSTGITAFSGTAIAPQTTTGYWPQATLYLQGQGSAPVDLVSLIADFEGVPASIVIRQSAPISGYYRLREVNVSVDDARESVGIKLENIGSTLFVPKKTKTPSDLLLAPAPPAPPLQPLVEYIWPGGLITSAPTIMQNTGTKGALFHVPLDVASNQPHARYYAKTNTPSMGEPDLPPNPSTPADFGGAFCAAPWVIVLNYTTLARLRTEKFVTVVPDYSEYFSWGALIDNVGQNATVFVDFLYLTPGNILRRAIITFALHFLVTMPSVMGLAVDLSTMSAFGLANGVVYPVVVDPSGFTDGVYVFLTGPLGPTTICAGANFEAKYAVTQYNDFYAAYDSAATSGQPFTLKMYRGFGPEWGTTPPIL